MADMFAPLVAQLKANPKTIVFTEGNDPRILEAASKLLAEIQVSRGQICILNKPALYAAVQQQK